MWPLPVSEPVPLCSYDTPVYGISEERAVMPNLLLHSFPCVLGVVVVLDGDNAVSKVMSEMVFFQVEGTRGVKWLVSS